MEDEQDAQSKFEKKRSEAQTSHGRLLAEKQVSSSRCLSEQYTDHDWFRLTKRYLDNLCSRQTLIQEIATRHSIAGYDHDLNEAEMAEFEQKLEDAIDEQNKKIQTMKVSWWSRAFLIFYPKTNLFSRSETPLGRSQTV